MRALGNLPIFRARNLTFVCACFCGSFAQFAENRGACRSGTWPADEGSTPGLHHKIPA